MVLLEKIVFVHKIRQSGGYNILLVYSSIADEKKKKEKFSLFTVTSGDRSLNAV